MKRMIIALLCMCVVFVSAKQETVANCCLPITDEPALTETNNVYGINFKKFKNLNAALKAAQKQDKMLMLVFTAKWCVPCNYMKRYVYTNKQISSYYNQNFISVLVDSERDKDFVKQVKEEVGDVNQIPSFLFFDSDKYFVFHFEGSQTTSEFLKKGHRALEEQRRMPK